MGERGQYTLQQGRAKKGVRSIAGRKRITIRFGTSPVRDRWSARLYPTCQDPFAGTATWKTVISNLGRVRIRGASVTRRHATVDTSGCAGMGSQFNRRAPRLLLK